MTAVTPAVVHAYGQASLITVGAGRVADYAAALVGWPEVAEVVPAAETLLVRWQPGRERAGPARLAGFEPAASTGSSASVVHLVVTYDGADLDTVARTLGTGIEQVIEWHRRCRFRVQFCGFAPGFAYLSGLDPQLVLPRRDTPRTRVPAGSVAIAGDYSAVYPTASPGGWHLLGHSSAVLFDPSRFDRDGRSPSLLSPGDQVRFVPDASPVPPVREPIGSVVTPTGTPAQATMVPVGPGGAVRVHEPGLFLTVQDRGRPGWARYGVSPSGAADPLAYGLANRLVGNRVGAAGLESVLGGVVLGFDAAAVVAVTGAPVPIEIAAPGAGGLRVGAMNQALAIPAGSLLRLGRPPVGLRTSVAVRGGLLVEPTLGSAATDTLGGLGPAPLTVGSVVGIGDDVVGLPAPDQAPVPPPFEEPTVGLVPGPRADWIGAEALDRLVSEPFTVTDQADRVGVRLAGPPLERARSGELASEPLVVGAVQVPPDGNPIVFGPDHPTTGGYPVVAVVAPGDHGVMAQLRPGQRVRFRRLRPVSTG